MDKGFWTQVAANSLGTILGTGTLAAVAFGVALLPQLSQPLRYALVGAAVAFASMAVAWALSKLHVRGVQDQAKDRRGADPAPASQLPAPKSTLASPVEASGLLVDTHPNLSEIEAEIKSRPPFQRKEAAAHYVGLKVRWSGTFSSITVTAHGGFRMYVRFVPLTLFVALLSPEQMAAYPWLRVLAEGAPVTVEGTVVEMAEIPELIVDRIASPAHRVA